jgi:DNA invertase Pin-like site-specific DNA recombinase
LASQDAQLHAAGCAKVYSKKVSGARSDRPELARYFGGSSRGDVLMVARLDRLARSTRDFNILHMLGERGIGFRSLADSWANTTTAHGRLLVTMLAGIAEFERELIRARTGEGTKRAQARGVRGASAACCGRNTDGYRAVLRREPCNYWAVARAGSTPFRRRGRPRGVKRKPKA